MNLIKLLGLTNRTCFHGSIVSRSGIGKTGVMMIMTGEFLDEGKKVLYLSDEMPLREISKRFFKILKGKEVGLTIRNFTDFEEEIDALLSDNNFDVIMVDGSIASRSKKLYNLARKHNCIVMCTVQARRTFVVNILDLKEVNQDIAQKSDIVINLTTTTLTFWEGLKYYFLFWLPKPNRVLGILKNRYGKSSKHNVKIDFQNLKVF